MMDAGAISEEQIACILCETLKGLDYLHSQGKIHRDIKAANILLSRTGEVKLADFGVAGQITVTMSKCHTFVGTPFWMAPEVIRERGYSKASDVFSLCVVVWEILTQQEPHKSIYGSVYTDPYLTSVSWEGLCHGSALEIGSPGGGGWQVLFHQDAVGDRREK